MSNSADRVRANTPDRINLQLDTAAAERVAQYQNRGSEEISRRIEELEKEWDTERTLEMNASALAFTGLLLGITRNKKWLFLPGLVLPFLFQHATHGWCPPLPILRRLGVRTRNEIDREKYALKALRGDFESSAGSLSSNNAFEAAK